MRGQDHDLTNAFNTLCSRLYDMLGYGKGRHLFQFTAEIVNGSEAQVSMPIPMSPLKKVVYTGQVPGRFLKNFSNYSAALNSRRNSIRQKSSCSATLEELTNLGLAMTGTKLLVFIHSLQYQHEEVIDPHALLMQGDKPTTWERWQSMCKVHQNMQHHVDALRQLEFYIPFLLLLLPYFQENRDIGRFWCAIAPKFRAAGQLAGRACKIILKGEFQGVSLNVQAMDRPGLTGKEYKLCHPTCQCKRTFYELPKEKQLEWRFRWSHRFHSTAPMNACVDLLHLQTHAFIEPIV